jgi:hypothetical protein
MMARFLSSLVLLALVGGFHADAQTTGSALNAGLLKPGRFLYRTIVRGEDAGDSEISIRKAPDSGNFVYTNRVSGAFSQQ